MGLFDGIRNLFGGQPSTNGNGHASQFDGQLKSLFQGQAPGLFEGGPMLPSQAPGLPSAQLPNFAIGTSNRGLFDGNGRQVPSIAPGQMHVYTFASLWNTTSKTYAWRWDEAYSRHFKDALAMRRDAFLMGLLFERKYPTAQMAWHLEPDDKKNPGQMKVADYLKACIDTLPNTPEVFMHLLEALWYGRAGGQITWTWKQVLGRKSYVPGNILPTNGDKVQFEWDGTPQIWLYGGVTKDSDPQKQRETVKRATAEIPGLLDEDTVFTDRGLMLRLKRPFWRDKWVIHKHDLVDADFFESEMHGGIHGIGIRHWIYWIDFIRREVMSYILDFLERTGQGFTIYYFDPGNPQDQTRAIKVAKEQGRNTWIVWPRTPGDKDATKGVERIEPNLAGAQALKDLMGYYDAIIERFIVGQSMSGGADHESGLGGTGRANFAKACVPVDSSEILTRDGFKSPEAVLVGEEVLAYDANTDTCKWTPLLAKSFYDDAEVVKMHHKAWSALCTPDHSWAVEKANPVGATRGANENIQTILGPRGGFLGKKRTRLLRKANELTGSDKIILAAPEVETQQSLLTPAEAAILGWAVTDGTIIRTGGQGVIPGDRRRREAGWLIRIFQSKEKNFETIRELVPAGTPEAVSRPFTRTFPTGRTYCCLPQHYWTMGRESSTSILNKCQYRTKEDLPHIVTRLNSAARKAMLEAFLLAEGSSSVFYNKSRHVNEAFDILCALEGLPTGKVRDRIAGVKAKAIKKYRYITTQKLQTSSVGLDRVWCPTTQFGTWVMRQNGCVMITGNTKQYIITHDCLKLAGTLSKDLVMCLLRQNRQNCEAIYGKPIDFSLRFKFDIDSADPKEKLEAAKVLYEMGVSLKEDEVRALAGLEKPSGDDAIIKNQSPGTQPGAPGQTGGGLFEGKPGGGGEGGPEEKDKKPQPPVRYDRPMIYAGDTQLVIRYGEEEWSLGQGEDWNRFASWANQQGGELAQLVRYGKADAARLRYELQPAQPELNLTIEHLSVKVDGDVQAGPVSAGDVQAGSVQAGAVSAGDVTAGNVKAGDVKAGPVQAGDVKAGTVQAGNVQAGDVKAGAVSAGEVKTGSVQVQQVNVSPNVIAQIPPRRKMIITDSNGNPIGSEEKDM